MKRVRELISHWLTRINVDNSVDYFDINKEAEHIARRLLNQLLDSELENLNLTKKRNFPGIDLAREAGFAVQVTSQRKAEKIRDSLEKFEKNELYRNYPKGVRFLVLGTEAPNFRKETRESFTQCYKDFNPDEHIWTKMWLLKRIEAVCQSDCEKDRDRFSVIVDILEEEFGSGEKWKDLNSRTHFSHLPPISEDYGFPRPPFRYLRRYRQEDTRIFFGRSYYIRKLFKKVTQLDSAAVTLLYGQSGVGKSSLLEAGLLPRLEGFSNVIYTRRNREKGLAGILKDVISDLFPDIPVTPQSFLSETWKQIEKQTGKPLIVLVDQLEEVFTIPNSLQPDELNDFVKLIKTVFSERLVYPRGRLVLGYRKEYHANIEAVFDKEELTDYSKLFLEPLDREAIIEIILGLTSTPVLRDRYNLFVEEWLPDIIANDLLTGKSTPVAPVLQFIMSKMWEVFPPNSYGVREFTIDSYHALREHGTAMKDFFRMQMVELENWHEEVVVSGLALDLLKFHCTPLATACSREMEELRNVYHSRLDILEALVFQLKNLYLLTDVYDREKLTKNAIVALAHDTLAPVVINEYNESDSPGQRAGRILATKIGDFQRNKDNIWLDEVDLDIVEQGKWGMRALKSDEEELLKISRKHKLYRERVRNRNIRIGVSLIIMIIVVAVFAVIQWRVAEKKTKEANAHRLAVVADTVVNEDPTLALRIAEQAWLLDNNHNIAEALHKIYRENLFYRTEESFRGDFCSIALSPDGRILLTGANNGVVRLWHLKDKLIIKEFKAHRNDVTSVAFSPDGKFILTGSWDHTAQLWDIEGNRMQMSIEHRNPVTSVAFSPDGKTILTGSTSGTVHLWDLQGNKRQEFEQRYYIESVISAAFSPDGKTIFTFSGHGQLHDENGFRDCAIHLWDLQGKLKQEFKYTGIVISAAFSPDGKALLIGLKDKTARLSDLEGKFLQVFKGHKSIATSVAFFPDGKTLITGSADSLRGPITHNQDNHVYLWCLQRGVIQEFKGHSHNVASVTFSKDGKYILTGSWDKTARLWNLQGNMVQEFKGHSHSVASVAFSPTGKTILTYSRDDFTRLWNLQGEVIYKFKGHTDWVKAVAFSPDGKTILTNSLNDTARLWDLEGNVIQEFKGHSNNVTAVAFSPDGKCILTGSWDNTARLWGLQGNTIQEFKGHSRNVLSVAFSPNGKNILTGSDDNTARLWDLEGNTIQELKGHLSEVTSVAFSPDGRFILTGSLDKTARLWNRRGYTVQEFKGHTDEVTSVAFSPDGRTVLTGSNDKTALLWQVAMPLAEFLKKGNVDPLSDDQKKKYGVE